MLQLLEDSGIELWCRRAVAASSGFQLPFGDLQICVDAACCHLVYLIWIYHRIHVTLT